MPEMSQPVIVYIDLDGSMKLVGRLWSHSRRGRESATFEYDRAWLGHPYRFALEPALKLGPGQFHTGADRKLFGSIGDSAPDSWGRMLIRRNARQKARKSGSGKHSLSEIDYLLAVDDLSRMGALRFTLHEQGPFLKENSQGRIPPLLALPSLLAAADHVVNNDESTEELSLLLAPGSSLGGARPKASILDRKQNLSIAKFPSRNDELDVITWEIVALNLAESAGIAVPIRRVEIIKGKPVLILRRFDRSKGVRIPFLSALSMIGAVDHEQSSYLEIADAIRRYGAAPEADLQNLWKRIVFNILISNVDDHMRNHAFLYTGPRGWSLSPAYDLNPTPTDVKPRILSTCIDLYDSTASLDTAFSVVDYFGIPLVQARSMVADIGMTVSKWRSVAATLGLPKTEIDRMETAFEHIDLKKATALI